MSMKCVMLLFNQFIQKVERKTDRDLYSWNTYNGYSWVRPKVATNGSLGKVAGTQVQVLPVNCQDVYS